MRGKFNNILDAVRPPLMRERMGQATIHAAAAARPEGMHGGIKVGNFGMKSNTIYNHFRVCTDALQVAISGPANKYGRVWPPIGHALWVGPGEALEPLSQV
jgi:hypothetical protein